MTNTIPSFATAMDVEIAALKAAIIAKVLDGPIMPDDPMAVKLRELTRLRATVYADKETRPPAPAQLPLTAAIVGTGATGSLHQDLPLHNIIRVGRRPHPTRVRAIACLKEYLRDRKEPVKTGLLCEYLVSQNIQLGGDNPANNLSALLHTTPGFRSHGRSGWTLPQEGMQ